MYNDMRADKSTGKRYVIVRDYNGNWRRDFFGNLKVGDVFQTFEADGTPVDDGAVNEVLEAPYVNNDGTYTVIITEYEEDNEFEEVDEI